MGYIYTYHKIGDKRAIKRLERAQAESEISQETKYRKSVIDIMNGLGQAQHWTHIKSAERHYTIGKRNIENLGYTG